MTGLTNLVRLHFWNVGEMRRRYERQVQLCGRIKDELARLEQDLEVERREACRTLDGALAYQTFVAPALERRQKLRDAVACQECEVASARGDLEAAFEDLKEYETARVLQDHHTSALSEYPARLALDHPGVSPCRRRAAEKGSSPENQPHRPVEPFLQP